MDYLPLIADLTKAIEQEPHCAYFYYNRGCLNYKARYTEKALSDFNKAIELHPELAEAYYNRGLIHIELNNYQQAYLDLSKAGELGLYSAYSLIKHFRKQQQTKKP